VGSGPSSRRGRGCGPTLAWPRARVEAINILLDVHGSVGFADASALRRIWQDANVAARHASLLPGIGYEVCGKAHLGIANDVATTVQARGSPP
jgi:hypothetical protein